MALEAALEEALEDALEAALEEALEDALEATLEDALLEESPGMPNEQEERTSDVTERANRVLVFFMALPPMGQC